MSQDHITTGWDSYEGFVSALEHLGISYEEHQQDQYAMYGEEPRRLRLATFTHEGRPMACREYLALDDGDSDGRSQIAIAVYPKDEPPRLYTRVIDGGHGRYPQPLGGISPRDFLYNIDTGKVGPVPEARETARS